jgi:hypothetical protein
MSKEILIKVGQIGGKVEEVMLDCNDTVEDAIMAAGKEPSNFDASIKGHRVSLTKKVSDGMRIVLTPHYKGGK